MSIHSANKNRNFKYSAINPKVEDKKNQDYYISLCS